jgi:16S rRNA (guanine966-N2)-methyltransferase
VFATLGPLDGERVLDLYAGSGALGIEALSRGAAHAVFIERARPAVAVLQGNLDALGLGADVAELRPGDVRAALRTARARAETYDVVFIDPPYRLAAGLGAELTKSLVGLLAPGSRVVTESDRRAPLALELPRTHERRYGDTLIRIHTR